MLGLAALITALSACGSAESPSSLLQISPASPEVAPGDAVQFTANSPAAPDETVAWAVVEPDGGTIDGTGVYTAPVAEGTFTVTASVTSLSTTQATQVRVKRNVRVDVSPTAATLAAGESLALSANVTGSVKTVTWSVAEGTAGGAVTAAGVYTAPLTAGVYDVVATSAADPTKSGSATITVTAQAPAPAPAPLPAVTIAASPQAASVVAGNTVQFTAAVTGSTNLGVTWSVAEAVGGTVSTTGLYTAPLTAGTYHVVARSSADSSKSATATVTVTAAPAPVAGSVYVIRPQYVSPTSNPLKGMTGPAAPPYSTVSLLIIPWNMLENVETDGVEKIQAVSDALFGSYPARNAKVVPRVTLDDNSGSHWPSDMTPGDYSSTQFQTRLTRLISRLGQVWDNDPRIAWVETGIFGKWGEQTQPTPSTAVQTMTVNAFDAAFRNKKLLRRVPYMFTTSTWGIYWDSWGCAENGQLAAMGETFWNQQVMQGEIAYDFCTITGATTPTQDVTIPDYISKNEDLIRQSHTTNLTWIAQAPYNDSTRAGMDRLQRAMGYEFTVDEVDYPQTIQPGQPFTIALKARNTGSAPFYYQWPVEVSLHNPADRSVVWKQTLSGVDIRSWKPGSAWSTTARAYSSPPATTTNQSTVTLSSVVPAGRYVLAIAILDPAGNLPTVRFAMRNYWMGGRHPIGYVGVGTPISSEVIDAAQFDDPGLTDTTLHYVK